MSLFFNSKPHDAIIRSFLFWITFILLLFAVGFSGHFFPAKWERFIYGIGGTIAAFITTWLFLKFERKKFRDIGLEWEWGTLTRFLKGFVIGVVMFAIIILLLMAFAGMQIGVSSHDLNPGIFFWYLAIIPLALMEEVAFRSYPFLKLNNAFGLHITQFIVAIVFAMYHVIGGQDLYSSLLGAGAWAFVFGFAAAWSGGIAVPTGIHVGINLMQPLFGFKSAYEPVWNVSFKNENAAEIVGVITQILILLSGIAATDYYIRKKRKIRNS